MVYTRSESIAYNKGFIDAIDNVKGILDGTVSGSDELIFNFEEKELFIFMLDLIAGMPKYELDKPINKAWRKL